MAHSVFILRPAHPPTSDAELFRSALLLAVSAGDLLLRFSQRSKSFMRTWCMTVGSFTTTVTGVRPVPMSATQSFWRKMIRAFATAS